MPNEKAKQKMRAVYEFGVLIQPLEELADAENPPELEHYRIAAMKVLAGDNAWRRTIHEFTTFGPDLHFQPEFQEISHVPERVRGRLNRLLIEAGRPCDLKLLQERFCAELEVAKTTFFEGIDRVPIEWEPEVFEANTPFTSYLRIRDAFAHIKHRVDYFDRYLKPDFIRLFLDGVSNDVSIRLVTTNGNDRYGVRAVEAIVSLAQNQFNDLRLIEVEPKDLHDRNLRVDNHIFTLGPGVDRAGFALTNFGPTDCSADAHAWFDKIIANGRII